MSAALTEHDWAAYDARVRRFAPRLCEGLSDAYGAAGPGIARRAMALATDRFARRPLGLRLHDLRRAVEPDWFQQPTAIGYAAYAERFAGTLGGVAEHAGYLQELGVTYLHLMPLLQPRPEPNDGGYAVMDYGAVRADLGTMDDLEALATELRRRGIALTLDLVLNHVAAEHDWARRARAGEQRYRDYFHVFADRQLPDAYERALPEVFPEWAPGSFTYDAELAGWVWTTFNRWQWDLNWHNPEVFLEFCGIILDLANRGVGCVRLDAIAFIWKRLGTNCQNMPEVHAVTQALRAVTAIAAPSTLFKAEAIVSPDDLAAYLGAGRRAGQVSDLAYHNSLMVQIWSSLAAGDARLASAALRRLPHKPPTTAWATYLRCHDDIGWAVDDGDAWSVGWHGPAHRHFLSAWYSGDHPGSDARGVVFQENAFTGDRRISGTAASLSGIEVALERGDDAHLDHAVARLLIGYMVVLSFGGLPLVYMGDELALRNDDRFADDPGHADDNRWVHRPAMDWDVAARRHQPGTLEHRVWHALRHAITVRASLPALHAAVETVVAEAVNPAVLAFTRPHPAQTLFALHNLSRFEQWWPRHAIPLPDGSIDALTGAPAVDAHAALRLPPYGAAWLVAGA